MPKTIIRTIPVLFVFFFGTVVFTNAQSVSAYLGLGSATDSSNGQSLDTIGDVGPSMGGVFITLGGDFMVRPKFGIGAEYSLRAAQTGFAPQADVNYRPGFYDFNAIWHPLGSGGTRIVPELQGGVGGVDLRFYETETQCAVAGVCQTLDEYISSSNHFQLHLSGGVRTVCHPECLYPPAS